MVPIGLHHKEYMILPFEKRIAMLKHPLFQRQPSLTLSVVPMVWFIRNAARMYLVAICHMISPSKTSTTVTITLITITPQHSHKVL